MFILKINIKKILFTWFMVFLIANLNATTLREYCYNCITTGKTITEWREYTPTTCIEDATHIVDWDTLHVKQIKEDPAPTSITNVFGATQGFYKAQSFIVSTTNNSVGSVFTTDYSFPFTISGLSITLNPGVKNIGDTISLLISPDTDCGIAVGDSNLGRVTQPVSVSDNILTVDAAVLRAVNVGYLITLKNGEKTEVMGRCIAKNIFNRTITVENAAKQTFAANTTHVLFTIEKIKDIKFYSATPIILGSSAIGGSEVPANTIGRVVYTNLTGGKKDCGIILEWFE